MWALSTKNAAEKYVGPTLDENGAGNQKDRRWIPSYQRRPFSFARLR